MTFYIIHSFSSLEYHPSQIERDGTMAYIDKNGNELLTSISLVFQIQAAVMGAQKGTHFLKDVLDWYQDKHFINQDGSLAIDVLSPYIYARIAENYGFIYKDQDQELDDNMKIFRSEIFAGNKHEVTLASYAIHYCAHSWKEKIDSQNFKSYCWPISQKIDFYN